MIGLRGFILCHNCKKSQYIETEIKFFGSEGGVIYPEIPEGWKSSADGQQHACPSCTKVSS